jgi:hypothetical protein
MMPNSLPSTLSWRLRGEYELLDTKLQLSRVTVCADDGLPLTLDFSLQRGRLIADDLNASAAQARHFLSRL